MAKFDAFVCVLVYYVSPGLKLTKSDSCLVTCVATYSSVSFSSSALSGSSRPADSTELALFYHLVFLFAN